MTNPTSIDTVATKLQFPRGWMSARASPLALRTRRPGLSGRAWRHWRVLPSSSGTGRCRATASAPRRGSLGSGRGRSGLPAPGDAHRSAPASDQAPCGRTARPALRHWPNHPVPHTLQRDVADQPRLRARAAIGDRAQGQQATGLGGILAPPRQAAQFGSRKVQTKRDGARHGEPPRTTSLNQLAPASGNPQRESEPSGLGTISNQANKPKQGKKALT